MADRITELQRELLAICRGGYAYETWARVTEQPINERADWRGRMAGQKRVDEIRREIHGINPDAALYFGWGPDERPQAREHFYAEATNRAIAAGKQARDEDKPRTTNPYKRDGSEGERALWHAWDIGWCRTRAEEDAAIGVKEDQRAERDTAYWAADRAAFEAAMDGEELDFTPWALPGIEHAYKADQTRLMYFAWTQAREFEAAACEHGLGMARHER